MGCNLVSEALHEMALIQGVNCKPILDEIILAAPDIPKARFIQIIDQIRITGSRLTLYASDRDKALLASRVLQAHPRVGDLTPNIFISPHTDSIDATAVGDDLLAHSYVAGKSVLIDIHALIVNSHPPNRRFGLEMIGLPPDAYWKFQT